MLHNSPRPILEIPVWELCRSVWTATKREGGTRLALCWRPTRKTWIRWSWLVADNRLNRHSIIIISSLSSWEIRQLWPLILMAKVLFWLNGWPTVDLLISKLFNAWMKDRFPWKRFLKHRSIKVWVLPLHVYGWKTRYLYGGIKWLTLFTVSSGISSAPWFVHFSLLSSAEERQVAAEGSPPLRDIGLRDKLLLEKEKRGWVGSGRSTILLWVGKILIVQASIVYVEAVKNWCSMQSAEKIDDSMCQAYLIRVSGAIQTPP